MPRLIEDKESAKVGGKGKWVCSQRKRDKKKKKQKEKVWNPKKDKEGRLRGGGHTTEKERGKFLT